MKAVNKSRSVRLASKYAQVLALVTLGLASSLGGCNLIAGIEKAEYDSDVGDGDGDEPVIPPVDRLPSWSNALWFDPLSCSQAIDVTEDLILGCMYRVSCDPWGSYYTFSQCVTYSQQTLNPAETCGLYATSCDQIDACLGRGYVDTDITALCAFGDQWVCDGDDAIRCEYSYKHDCAALGAVCAPHASVDHPGVMGCGPGPDVVIDCTDKVAGQHHCEGDFLYNCVDGVPQGYDCAATGTTCRDETPGEAFCGAPLVVCDDPGTSACTGTQLDICESDGSNFSVECADAGLACYSNPETGSGSCNADGCADAVACEEGCYDSTTLRFCVGGASVLFDCAAYGAGDCYEGTYDDGDGGSYPFAQCTF